MALRAGPAAPGAGLDTCLHYGTPGVPGWQPRWGRRCL